MSSTS
ncbi:hypothetical protein CXB51_029654 [Gossypium anomalum]